MDLDGQIRLGHLLLNDRTCSSCGETKNLIEGFYRTRKDKGSVPSSYSYECKECTVKRVSRSVKNQHINTKFEENYPDW
jgi:hypothetical protein